MVDGLVSALPGFATDFFGRKLNRKIRVTKKEKLKLAEAIDRLIDAQNEIESYRTPPQTAAEYASRLDRVGELYAPFLRIPKSVSFAQSLRDGYKETTHGIGRWTYFPRTNYRKVAADLDSLTSAAFANKAAATDGLLNEFWSSPDGIVIMRTPYTIVIRRCLYLGNAKRKLDRRLIERLVETYRELSGLYEKAIRAVVGIMELLEGHGAAYGEIAKRPLGSNLDKVRGPYQWLTADFDVTIRNSIAHTTYVVSYDTRMVTFRDNKNTIGVGFRDLFRRCRLLSSLVVGLLFLHVFFFYWRWKAVSDQYDSAKKHMKIGTGSNSRSTAH